MIDRLLIIYLYENRTKTYWDYAHRVIQFEDYSRTRNLTHHSETIFKRIISHTLLMPRDWQLFSNAKVFAIVIQHFTNKVKSQTKIQWMKPYLIELTRSRENRKEWGYEKWGTFETKYETIETYPKSNILWKYLKGANVAAILSIYQ